MELVIRNIPNCLADASNVSRLMDTHGIEWNEMGCHNWSESYPYKPKALFRVAHSDRQIFIQYAIEEKSIRAVAASDNGPVWEDSCCEFFIAPQDDGIYYNMECNCIGTLLIGVGKGRDNRLLATPDILQQVKRWTTLERKPTALQKGIFRWQLALIIPIEAFFLHPMENLSGMTMKCNFYKCGDKLSEPHFLSWSPIASSTPDFHRIDCFAPCVFIPNRSLEKSNSNDL